MKRFIPIASLLLLSGCGHLHSSLDTSGPAADRIARMQWFMIGTFVVVTIVMFVLVLIAATRRRGTLAEHGPIDEGGGLAMVAIGGLLVPLIILTVVFVAGLKLMASFPMHSGAGMHAGHDSNDAAMARPEIRIMGHQWWWEVTYLQGGISERFTTANEIHIPVGRPIDIELVSADVIHSFWVPQLHGKVDLIPGHTNFIRVQATLAGQYSGQCAEFCGAQHAHMGLLVVADAPAAYEVWRQRQLNPASEPLTDIAKAGQQVFLSGPCALCHRVRGTLAGGAVAPDLTHIASRKFIAANTLPNNVANLEAWATHAQALKPEVLMPNLTVFTGEELQQLTAYLQQLK